MSCLALPTPRAPDILCRGHRGTGFAVRCPHPRPLALAVHTGCVPLATIQRGLGRDVLEERRGGGAGGLDLDLGEGQGLPPRLSPALGSGKASL